MSGTTRFLDPLTLARIDNLDLLARTVVSGFVHGLHQSPHLGVSTDFAEHRPYMTGDDIRRIDWRVYGRTDRLYVKEFEAETWTKSTIASIPLGPTSARTASTKSSARWSMTVCAPSRRTNSTFSGPPTIATT